MDTNSRTDADTGFLRVVGRNRGMVRPLAERLHGGNCDRLLRRLETKGRIKVIKNALDGGVSWYQLSEVEARRLQMPEPNPVTQRTQIRKNATLLFFTSTAKQERLRLIPSECRELAGDDTLISPHIAERNGDDSAIYRVFIPEPKAKEEPFMNAVREHAFKALDHPRLAEWVRRNTYRFLILLHSANPSADTKAAKLRRIAERKGFPTLTVKFETVPLFERLFDALPDCTTPSLLEDSDDE